MEINMEIKKMRSLFLLLASLLSALSYSTEPKPQHFINSAYYAASESKLFMGLSEVYQGGADKSGIYIYDTKLKKGEWIALSEAFASEHIVGIFPSKDKNELYLLTQVRKAGTAKPNVIVFDLEKKSFVGVNADLDCANILDATSQSKKLILKCGPDPHHTPKYPSLEIIAPNMVEVLSEKQIDWIPSKPNSMTEAKALILKLPTEKLRIEAESLFK